MSAEKTAEFRLEAAREVKLDEPEAPEASELPGAPAENREPVPAAAGDGEEDHGN